jgi:uncharacterized membrane protein YdbT with pleckstrin-like domain
MSYVSNVLGKDESVTYEAAISLLAYWKSFLVGGLFLLFGLASAGIQIAMPHEVGSSAPTFISLFFLAISAFILAPPFIAKMTTELVITNRRIIAKFGLLRRYTIEINLSKIESIRVDQSILGRMLNYGSLLIVGTGGSKEPIPEIINPLEFRRRYDQILESHG